MGWNEEIARRETLISRLGAALLAWCVFESIQFLYSGQLGDLAGTLPRFFQTNMRLGLYVVFHLIMATAGAFVAIPLLVRGRTAGVVIGVAYRLSGNTLDPLTFLLPDALLMAQDNEPTFLSQALDILWLIASIITLVLYFLLRRQKEQPS